MPLCAIYGKRICSCAVLSDERLLDDDTPSITHHGPRRRPETASGSREHVHEGKAHPDSVSACLFALWLISAFVHAQDAAAPSDQAALSTTQPEPTENHAEAAPDAAAPAVLEPTPSPFSLQLNLDFTNAYFYHGILQQDKGVIVQPAAKLTLNLFQRDDFKLDALLATWNSFGRNSGSQHSELVKYWYESDLIAGFVLTKGKFSLTTTYTFLMSPSDAFATVQELDFTFAYDDSDLLGAWALHPYALLGIETGANGSDGADSNAGTYLELGVAPGFAFDVGKTPISLSFPLSVGLSLHDYYQNAAGEDDTFGFFQVGMKASVPLPFGDRYGKWTLNAGVSGLFLGDHTTEYNHGNDTQVIGTIGLQLNF
jgi:hypothetical protein